MEIEETIKHYQQILDAKESQITQLKQDLTLVTKDLRFKEIQVLSLESRMESVNQLCNHYQEELSDVEERIKLLRVVAIGSFTVALGLLIGMIILN